MSSGRRPVLEFVRETTTLSAQPLGEARDFGGCDRPDLCGIDPVVVVRERDAQTDDVAPWHVGVFGPRLFAHRLRRLADDLQ